MSNKFKDVTSGIANNKALESLARTDDILALIGVIMIIGVIVSAYGSFWQGRYAKASFNNQCSSSSPTQLSDKDKQHRRIMVAIGISILLLVVGTILYIRSRNKVHSEEAK